MNAVAWWSAVAISLAVLCGAWRNMVAQRRLRGRRAIYISALFFVFARVFPLVTWMLVPAAGPWVWLLVALAANGVLMIGVDRALTRM
jgi:hypothetical protein